MENANKCITSFLSLMDRYVDVRKKFRELDIKFPIHESGLQSFGSGFEYFGGVRMRTFGQFRIQGFWSDPDPLFLKYQPDPAYPKGRLQIRLFERVGSGFPKGRFRKKIWGFPKERSIRIKKFIMCITIQI